MSALTKAEVASLVKEIKRFVEAELPEDEHDHTATWVYEAAIYVTSQRLAARCYRHEPVNAEAVK
jgi:hypothetical protein